ncbi:MAG TPA: Hpt domain-containing protein [Terracidiphilus sp.]|nr:Hpt domain-containing protein [Terracidiphilus sp.]
MGSTANPAASSGLAAALERLWLRFQPEIRERVAVLESAAHALAAGALTAEQQGAAHAAAHNLAGVLGTFNLERGSELARELEHLYESAPDSTSAPRLAERTGQLRTLIESRK